MPSEFLLSQLAIACKVSVAVQQSHRFSCRAIVRRCGEFFLLKAELPALAVLSDKVCVCVCVWGGGGGGGGGGANAV